MFWQQHGPVRFGHRRQLDLHLNRCQEEQRDEPFGRTDRTERGVISRPFEEKGDGVICRNFSTTRHSYEGIAYFSGKTCTSGTGNWQLMSFDRQS